MRSRRWGITTTLSNNRLARSFTLWSHTREDCIMRKFSLALVSMLALALSADACPVASVSFAPAVVQSYALATPFVSQVAVQSYAVAPSFAVAPTIGYSTLGR